MHDAQHWAILMHDTQPYWCLMHSHVDVWCTAFSHILMPDSTERWMHSIDPYNYWCILQQYWYIIIYLMHNIEPCWYLIEPLSHVEQYWCLSHSIELFWYLMICCIELSTLHLKWTMRLWTVRMRELRNMELMVDSRSWKLCYISKIKASLC